MYLKRLELQGFKTFAQKTVLEFMPDGSGRRGITAIVGPNGSGKSNVADALRWVMGEQSLKLLRSKKSEDVIFSGTDVRARSGFAEVSMIIENDDRQEVDMSEIVVTRRLYRDGQSEYEVNKQGARLGDVVLLLAQCGIGQRTYSVIGQGMVDQVLVASPSERKEFFDEAFGLRPFQLKRTSAINKLDDSRKNLAQTEVLLREIGPRLVTLERQIKRLEQRDTLEKELKSLEQSYYGSQWREISEQIKLVSGRMASATAEQNGLAQEAKGLEEELSVMEKAVPPSQGFKELRLALDTLAKERAELRERQLKLETKKAVEAVRQEKPWSPLPLSKIIEAIDGLRSSHEKLEQLVSAEKPDLAAIRAFVKELKTGSVDLVAKLQRPAPEVTPPLTPSLGMLGTAPRGGGGFEKEVLDIAGALADVAERTAQAEAKLEDWNKNEEGKRTHIFEVQHKLNAKRSALQQAEHRVSSFSVDMARLETRRDGFLADLRQYAPNLEGKLESLVGAIHELPMQPDASGRLQRLRSQLEWIGGIDPETIKEHKETKERFEFLSKQVEDLRGGINALDIVIKELDETIRGRSATAFKTLDREFTVFFKKLFDGGEAKLIEIEPEPEVDEQGNIIVPVEEGAVAGIDIQATPPGKRAKSIALLSGGERALTSIALICAIMATNPSPFVVLDEVDAALDESNSRKFAEIIGTLSDKTQFIVVSHNRATMARSHVLYGVTMGDDGVSQLLSVKLEDVEKLKKSVHS
ncbi:MAG: AAA family ATPase [bacterium]|nr:AAA family ATPase [bacterium]